MSQRPGLIVGLIVAAIACALAAGCGPKPPQPMAQDLPMAPAKPTAASPPAAAPATNVGMEASKLPPTPPVAPQKTAATTPAAPQPTPAKPSPPTKAAPAKTTPPPSKSQSTATKQTATAAKSEGTVVIGTIELVSKIPDPSTLPYDTCVTFIKYKVNKVVSGSYDGDSLLAVFWGLRKGKLQPAASFRVGQTHRLTIEPFSEHEELARVMQADDTNEYSLTPYWVVSYTAE